MTWCMNEWNAIKSYSIIYFQRSRALGSIDFFFNPGLSNSGLSVNMQQVLLKPVVIKCIKSIRHLGPLLQT